MTHGPIPYEPMPPLLVIHPGPVAKVFRDGCEVAALSPSQSAALAIAAQLLTAVSVKLPHDTATPIDPCLPSIASGISTGKGQYKAETKAPPTPEERIDMYVKAIKDGTALGQLQNVTVQMAQTLLHSNRVTMDDLRKRGIAA